MKQTLSLAVILCLVTLPAAAVLPIPVTLPPGISNVLNTLGGLLGIGGLSVTDGGTHSALTAVIAEQQRALKQLEQEYSHMKKMAQQLMKLPTQAQWAPWIKAQSRDTYGINGAWLGNLNGHLGGYMGSVYGKVPELGPVLDRLSAEARERLKVGAAHVELSDGLGQEALDVIGMIRDKVPQAEKTLAEIEGIAHSNADSDATEIGRLQLISQAAVVQGRTQQDSNKLLVQLVQQQALVSAQVRDQQIMHFEQQVGQAQGFGTAGAYVGDPVAEAKGFRW